MTLFTAHPPRPAFLSLIFPRPPSRPFEKAMATLLNAVTDSELPSALAMPVILDAVVPAASQVDKT
jgi:hypothetical protein